MNSKYMLYFPDWEKKKRQFNSRSKVLVVSSSKVHCNISQDKKKLFAHMTLAATQKSYSSEKCIRRNVPEDH